MIAKIIKITDKVLNSSEGKSLQSYSCNLPLFSSKLEYNNDNELSEYVLQLWQINNGCRYPTWIPFLNEDDFNKINIYWEWMISEKLDNFEFLL